MSEVKFKPWPGNQFDFSDKELFQIHEDLCHDLEITGYSESDIVKVSVGIWAGLKFAQDNKKELEEMNKNCISLSLHESRMRVIEAELEAVKKERDELKSALTDQGKLVKGLSEFNVKATNQLTEAIKALEFYGDTNNWVAKHTDKISNNTFDRQDAEIQYGPCGKLARETLTKLHGGV